MNGYFDLQVNGYAGADFNSDDLKREQIRVACDRLRSDGVSQILATVITDHVEAMQRRLAAIVDAREVDPVIQDVIAGIHIEGPFLNPSAGYIGAHPVDAACDASLSTMRLLLDSAGGLTKIVTLAPERDKRCEVTKFLADEAIVVAAGHSDAKLDQLNRAIDAGLSMFTHLGNGCPGSLPRHDNIVQRVLSLAGKLRISFIADGAHIPLFALQNYLATAGVENCVVVTDAISAAGLGPGTYTLGDQSVEIGEDLVPWSADRSHFVGSATTMPRMQANLQSIGLDDASIDWLLRVGPKAIISP